MWRAPRNAQLLMMRPSARGSVDVARAGPSASEADRQFRSRCDLSLGGAKASYNVSDRFGADGIEEVLPQAPGEGLRPSERHEPQTTSS
jgi:hypothetical protein